MVQNLPEGSGRVLKVLPKLPESGIPAGTG